MLKKILPTRGKDGWYAQQGENAGSVAQGICTRENDNLMWKGPYRVVCGGPEKKNCEG